MKTTQLIILTMAALMAGAALAHTELKATVPADRATLTAMPEQLELTFSEPVRLTALSIQRDEAQKQSLGPLPGAAAAQFAVALPAGLAAGHYVVSWRALAEDTHVMSGEYMFAVGAEGGHDAHATAPAQTAAPAQPSANDAQGGHGAH